MSDFNELCVDHPQLVEDLDSAASMLTSSLSFGIDEWNSYEKCIEDMFDFDSVYDLVELFIKNRLYELMDDAMEYMYMVDTLKKRHGSLVIETMKEFFDVRK